MEWNIERDGFKAFCPYCGERLMFCDECRHSGGESDCNYSSETDSCRHNLPKQERAMTNEEKIKNMSREELAEFMADFYHDGACFVDPPYCKEPCTKSIDYPCRLCVEEWLAREVKR